MDNQNQIINKKTTAIPAVATPSISSSSGNNNSFNHIYVKKKNLLCLFEKLEKISIFFGVKLCEITNNNENQFTTFQLVGENNDVELGCDLINRVQQYVDSLFVTEAEDSSYDSDCEGDDVQHQQVSRTTSDTLGQEFAEYVSQAHDLQQRPPGYTQRVEFALKLGYTERLVQAALGRLGPAPAQNELLAELIKLGAQQVSKGDFCAETYCDNSTLFTNDSCNSNEEPIITNLRAIVIDGSNVAMSHGNKEAFSCRGIRICVDWFKNRGHKDITVFVPKWRKENCRPDNPVKDQEILNELEKERMLVFTPSRLIGGKRMVCYDDRYILKLAVENDGIIVSNDNYRDLVQESTEFKKVVEERVLMYSFVNDRFMPPDDPCGRTGPTLDNFLKIAPRKGDHPPPPCPYGKKCTYGNKCKFNHPERGSLPHKSVTERLSEHAYRHLQQSRIGGEHCNRNTVQGKSLSVPLCSSGENSPIANNESRRKSLCEGRTKSGALESTSKNITSYNCPLIEHHQQQKQQQSHHQQIQNQYNQPTRNCWEVQHQFPKSHSIENISRTDNFCGQVPQSKYTTLWCIQQQLQQQKPNLNQSETFESASDECNLHRKLQRQLTLNPANCDPRIYQLQRSGIHQNSQSQLSPHRILGPSASGPRSHHPTQWDLHQNVTRIASAPDSSRPWHNGPPPASSSEPHINLWPQPRVQSPLLAAQDQRRRLHYHLASIFPEEQVQTVMQMYPDETNPQKICAAILNMFPKI